MKKEEMLYREIASDYMKGTNRFTQLELSRRLSISISTVNAALKNVSRINAVQINNRSFSIIALDRLLAYWATHRNIERDIHCKITLGAGVNEIESSMSGGIAFAAYTAYKRTYSDVPADYGEVYVYATENGAAEIKRRFRQGAGTSSIVVLKADPVLERMISAASPKIMSVAPAQIFVDLWNIRTWYAKEFADALSKRIFGA